MLVRLATLLMTVACMASLVLACIAWSNQARGLGLVSQWRAAAEAEIARSDVLKSQAEQLAALTPGVQDAAAAGALQAVEAAYAALTAQLEQSPQETAQ